MNMLVRKLQRKQKEIKYNWSMANAFISEIEAVAKLQMMQLKEISKRY